MQDTFWTPRSHNFMEFLIINIANTLVLKDL